MFSISVMMTAFGHVEVSGTDCEGGCSFPIASAQVDLVGLPEAEACSRVENGLLFSAVHSAIRPQIRTAVRALCMCLPPPEDFDK